jgi:manganese transport protein
MYSRLASFFGRLIKFCKTGMAMSKEINDTGLYDVTLRRNKAGSALGFKISQLLKFLGPAFVVSVAYIDPGNFATNIRGGALYNYNLLWVILVSNIMAIFLQINSAKLGIATGQNLSTMCGRLFSRKTNWVLWGVAGLASIATTMAEFLGGALGLNLLFGIPFPVAGVLTALITFGIISMQKYGQKAVEIVIVALLAVICACYSAEVFLAKPDFAQIGAHIVVPSIPDGRALLLAAGMLGATVMPHVIYLHSQLVQHRNGDVTVKAKKRHLKMEKMDVAIAMNIAFVVNAAMVVVSAAVFFSSGVAVETIEQAHLSLQPLLGSFSGAAFAIALIASGFSSSAVGAMAGETVMNGFVHLKMPVNVRRLIIMLPAMLVILSGVNPMDALVLSQVFLSFALPFAVIPLLIITGRKDVMGAFANKPFTKVLGFAVAGVILALNAALLYMTFAGAV